MKPPATTLPLVSIHSIEGDRVVELTYGRPSNRWYQVTEVKVNAKIGDPFPEHVRVEVSEL